MMLPRLNNFDMLDDVFNDSFFNRKERLTMKTDIIEKDDNYVLKIDLPGCNKDDIKLELNDGYLTVSATIENEENDENKNYIHKERFYGEASRTFYTGKSITDEDIDASFKNGILTISFPKENIKENSNKKTIEIKD